MTWRKNDASRYTFIHNIADDQFDRRFLNQTRIDVSNGTAGAPPLRSFDWIDFNGDTKLDLATFGSDLRIHMNDVGLNESARLLDCDPPTQARECANNTGPKLDMVSFAGTALPTAPGRSLVLATFPDRKLYRVYPSGDVTPLSFPGDSCSCASSCMNCPGPDCSCTYNCNACVPVLALVARDIDADHLLDLIAIDAKLNLYIAKAVNNYQWGGATPVPTAFPSTFFSVDVSVSGAPIP